jgi:hypothetical protein
MRTEPRNFAARLQACLLTEETYLLKGHTHNRLSRTGAFILGTLEAFGLLSSRVLTITRIFGSAFSGCACVFVSTQIAFVPQGAGSLNRQVVFETVLLSQFVQRGKRTWGQVA